MFDSGFKQLCIAFCVLGIASGNNRSSGGGGFTNFGGGPRPNQTPRPHKPSASLDNTGKVEEILGCNCLAISTCPPGNGQLEMACILEKGGNGICCIPQEGDNGLASPGFGSDDSLAMEVRNTSIAKGVKKGEQVLSRMKQDEDNRMREGEFVQRGTPERGHAYFFRRRDSSRASHKAASFMAYTSAKIAKEENMSPTQASCALPGYNLGSEYRSFQCPADTVPICDVESKFRTIDGTCNNLQKLNLGKSDTRFGRLVPSIYEDGIMSPRTKAVDGSELPNVRDASNNILLDIDIPATQFTLNLMQFGQFIDHDLAHAPFADMDGEAIRCCREGSLIQPQPNECFTINIPNRDKIFFPRGQRCINFVRSMFALNENCALGPVEQLNSLTHWLDGSNIYGSTKEEKEAVVDQRTGFLKTSANNLLPINATIECAPRIPGTPCFVAGDTRVNEHPGLIVMHTIWMRQHNRIASGLKSLNPRLTPEQLFEETRRIVVAQYQHTIYNEWLPIIIGESTMKSLRIKTFKKSFRRNYDPTIDASQFNEFATAAFRFGHSLVQGSFKLISSTGRQSNARLRDIFNAPHLIMNDPELVDDYVRCLTNQNIQSLDNFISEELTNHLFQTPAGDIGMDLISLNIQRGRDHAIGTYNQLRETLGMGRAKSFSDLLNTTPADLVRRLQTVYRSVDDIDLFVGGMTEKNLDDGLLGPLFSTIVGRQFQYLRKGDRFSYDMRGQAGSFTLAQLQEIRKTTEAKTFCENSNVKMIQPQAFRVPSSSNAIVPCSELPDLDLSVFV